MQRCCIHGVLTEIYSETDVLASLGEGGKIRTEKIIQVYALNLARYSAVASGIIIVKRRPGYFYFL